jgi:lysozyme
MPPADGLLRGVDVSDAQPRVDWEAAAASGVSFAFVKATEGATWTSRSFAERWRGARAAGLKVSAYGWFKPRSSSPEAQAAHLLEVYRAVEGWADMPLVLDVEEFHRADGISSAELARRVLACAEVVEEETGVAPLVYTYSAFALDHFRGAEAAPLARLPLWLADYRRTPVVPPPWADWAVLQTTGSGSCPGIAGPVDLDLAKPGAFLT